MNRLGSIAAFIAAASAPTVASAYCPGADRTRPNYRPDYYSVPMEFKRAKFVVEGVVTNETWLGDDGKPKPLAAPLGSGDRRPWGLAAPYMGAWYDVQVTRRFKGHPPAHLRLFSENSTARFWLNKGGRYLLFVSDEMFDQPIRRAMTLDICGNSAKFNRALASRLERQSTRR
jgi:hypothetical protein